MGVFWVIVPLPMDQNRVLALLRGKWLEAQLGVGRLSKRLAFDIGRGRARVFGGGRHNGGGGRGEHGFLYFVGALLRLRAGLPAGDDGLHRGAGSHRALLGLDRGRRTIRSGRSRDGGRRIGGEHGSEGALGRERENESEERG